jgi:hypothetical protein
MVCARREINSGTTTRPLNREEDDDRNSGVKKRADIGFRGAKSLWLKTSKITNQERLLMLGRNAR